MRMLFSSPNLEEITSVKNLLTRADIPCQVVNDAKTPAMIKLALYPELWIEQDDDFLAASVLLASWRRQVPTAATAFLQAQQQGEKALGISPV